MKPETASISSIEPLIRTIRDQKVILDSDLASIYGVPAKRLNEQVKRNMDRFPPDFLFQLTSAEFAAVRLQSATLNGSGNLKSQIATSSSAHGGRRKLPWAFTENGAIMAANVLNSPQAVRMSVFVVRAFVKMRELLGGTKELARQLRELEAKLTNRQPNRSGALIR